MDLVNYNIHIFMIILNHCKVATNIIVSIFWSIALSSLSNLFFFAFLRMAETCILYCMRMCLCSAMAPDSLASLIW